MFKYFFTNIHFNLLKSILLNNFTYFCIIVKPTLKHIHLIQRTTLAEITFWILLIAVVLDYKVHWSDLLFPAGIVMLNFLVNNENKNKQI
jgi:hypothetical protein